MVLQIEWTVWDGIIGGYEGENCVFIVFLSFPRFLHFFEPQSQAGASEDSQYGGESGGGRGRPSGVYQTGAKGSGGGDGLLSSSWTMGWWLFASVVFTKAAVVGWKSAVGGANATVGVS